MKKLLRIMVCLGAVFMIAACSSSGKRTVLNQKAEAIAPNSILALEVHSPDPNAEAQKLASILHSKLTTQLLEKRLFRHIVRGHENAHYDLKVIFLDYNRVSIASSILFGALSGNNETKTDVILRDRRDNHIITRFTAEGEDASHPWSSERGIGATLEEVATQIVLGLQ